MTEKQNNTLKQEVQLPGESFEEFFNRVIAKAKTEERTLIISIGVKYVDVTPETTYDYLRGFLDGFRSYI